MRIDSGSLSRLFFNQAALKARRFNWNPAGSIIFSNRLLNVDLLGIALLAHS